MIKVPAVSVMLPFYNAESTLGLAVESICTQSFGDFDLLLVNNHSADGRDATAKKWASGDTREQIRIYLTGKNRRDGKVFIFLA
ncbi:MAG: glycosyltransferase [Mariniphaga sp.]